MRGLLWTDNARTARKFFFSNTLQHSDASYQADKGGTVKFQEGLFKGLKKGVSQARKLT